MAHRCLSCSGVHPYAAVMPFLCPECEHRIRPGRQQPAPYRTDLTPAGEQYVIPGCEAQPKPNKTGAAQLSLFG